MENFLQNKSKAVAAIVVFIFLAATSITFSQSIQDDTIKRTPDEKIIKSNSDPANKYDQITSIDSTKYSVFGNLLNDDPMYNRKYPVWIPVSEVLGAHAFLGLTNKYALKADFGNVGFNSWQHNINSGWEWDFDRFGMNFLIHPYSGGLNFMSARSNGYNYWESLPFPAFGSLMWEYFGENTHPSYNDIVNTTISGSFYGEVLYRLSSNLLDDRTTGANRFFRELGAAVLSPTRFFNRLVQGKLSNMTTDEVYQKEPLNIELSVGMRELNAGRTFWTGSQNPMISVQLDYGYPFEKREWKPFDYFKVRSEANFEAGRKLINSITGYGILFGKNYKSSDLELLIGGFQHYNYFDNTTFELGAISIGGGILSKYSVSKETYLFTNFHLGIVPLAGNSTRFGPDTSQIRDYNYGGGMETKLESGINLEWASIQLIGYYYWIHTYIGTKGDNLIGILKPRISVKLYGNLYIGFEQLAYFSDRYTYNSGNYHLVRTEQKVYLTLNVGNFKL